MKLNKLFSRQLWALIAGLCLSVGVNAETIIFDATKDVHGTDKKNIGDGTLENSYQIENAGFE